MKKTAIVFKYELLNILRSRSFILILILVPLLSFSILLIANALKQNAQESTGATRSTETSISVEGFVDQSGLIGTIPAEIGKAFKQYPDEPTAARALGQGEIASFYVIPDDYLSSGEVTVYRPEFNPLGGMQSSEAITYLLNANLLRDDPQVLARIRQPYMLSFKYLTPQVEGEQTHQGLAFFLPFLVTFLIYLLILTSASLLLNSVAKEKENRIMEILLTSANPLQLLTGKIVALGLVGLLQTTVWSAAGLLILRFSGQMFAIPDSFQLPASILVWAVVFFLLGYAIYASLMAGIGALVPNLRESSQATLLVLLPLIIPMMFISALIQNPNSPVMIAFSLFPLTSSVTMMARLAAGPVPIWQPVLAAVLTAAAAMIILRAVAGMFHAKYLLAGKEFKFGLFLRALFGRL